MRALRLLGLAVCAGFATQAAAHCPASDGRGIAKDEYLEQLRTCAWQLLEPLTARTEGFPDPAEWHRADTVVPDLDEMSRNGLRRAEEHAVRNARSDQPPQEPHLYEMTFFNRAATDFIRGRLDYPAATRLLMSQQVREVQLPAGSAVLKLFLYHLPRNGTVDVRIWDWAATLPQKPGDPAVLRLDVNRLTPQCVADSAATAKKASAQKKTCLVAKDTFYTIRVDKTGEFACVRPGCPPLQPGDQLIVVGLHIAAKEMPEWLWSTFWWQGPAIPDRAGWTCGAAQRPGSIRSRAPWNHYAMNVTASFKRERSQPEAGDATSCGSPGVIGDGEELLAMYNPFVEARMLNGLKSSCVDCHSKASTSTQPERTVPDVGTTGGPMLGAFEGHLRLDYLWSLRRPLAETLPRSK